MIPALITALAGRLPSGKIMAAILAGLLITGLGVALLITSARLDAARSDLKAEKAARAAEVREITGRLVAAQAHADELAAAADALADQVRDTEAACARERQRRDQARTALANVKPVPLKQAEESYAVVDLESSAHVAAVLNDVFAGLRHAAGPGRSPAGPVLPDPGAAGVVAPGPERAPGQRP